MEKRRGLLLSTLLLLLGLAIFTFLVILSSGYRLSEGIMFTFTNYFIHGIIESALSGISILLILGGTGLSAFFLLLSIIFFFIYPKKPKMTITTYVAVGLALVSVLGTFLSVFTVQFLMDVNNFVCYLRGSYAWITFYESDYYRITTYPAIQETVAAGLGMLFDLLVMGTVIIPFVTYVLSFFLGRGKKKQPEVEEQPKPVEGIEEIK